MNAHIDHPHIVHHLFHSISHSCVYSTDNHLSFHSCLCLYIISSYRIMSCHVIMSCDHQIFDEILVNAADNKQRDKKMTTIQVTVELINPSNTTTNSTSNTNNTNNNTNSTTPSTKQRKGTTTQPSINTSLPKLRISVYNDGKGIPVAMHATEQMYIPELIFGHLLTGSNFNDTQVSTVGTVG